MLFPWLLLVCGYEDLDDHREPVVEPDVESSNGSVESVVQFSNGSLSDGSVHGSLNQASSRSSNGSSNTSFIRSSMGLLMDLFEIKHPVVSTNFMHIDT